MWPTLPSSINEHNLEKPSGVPVLMVGSTHRKDK